jgi:hypothetical protein
MTKEISGYCSESDKEAQHLVTDSIVLFPVTDESF